MGVSADLSAIHIITSVITMVYGRWFGEASEFSWLVSIILISLVAIIPHAEFGVKLILEEGMSK